MKQIFPSYLITFAVIFFLAGCNGNQKEMHSPVAVKLNIGMADYSALTYITGSHIWEEGDKVRLVEKNGTYEDTTSPFSYGSERATFLYSIPIDGEQATVAGIYPHDADISIADGRITYEVPQQQDGTLMALQGGKAVVKRNSYQGNNMSLRPLYKVINVSVGRSNRSIRSVTLKAADGSMISGKTEIDIETWKQKPISASVTVTLKEALDCSLSGQSVPVMVADTDADAYIAEITSAEGETFPADAVTEGFFTDDKSYDLGISQALFGSLSKSEAESMPKAGVKYIEVTMNTFWRNQTLEECYKRARSTKEIIDNTEGLEVWSVHLPFSNTLDISVLDNGARAENVATMAEMIRLAGEFGPKKLVLHPSSEPIAEADRQARLNCAKESIGKLLPVAKEIGAQLCIENLPRTCLGRTSGDMKYLIEDYPEVMICFDTNHLLMEDHNMFFSNVGNRIGTIHASDYDKTDERHWMPGLGIINWPHFLTCLLHYGYEGVFMTEVKGSYTAADVARVYEDLICKTK